MRLLDISYSTVEYIWFPISVKIDGINFFPSNPQISFAFVNAGLTPTEDDYNNGFTGNISLGINDKPYISFLFNGTVVGTGRFDLWLRFNILSESVKRRVAAVHVV